VNEAYNKAIMQRQQAGWTNFPLFLLCFFRFASTKTTTPNSPHMAGVIRQGCMHNFTTHIGHGTSKFNCSLAGGSEEIVYVANVKNKLNEPASPDKIMALRNALGEKYHSFLDLYGLHDGIELYIQDVLPAVRFYSLKECKTKNKQLKKWFGKFDSESINRIKSKGIAFGEIMDSSNVLLIENGIVSFFNWYEGGEELSDLSTFLNDLATDPVGIMNKLGCMVRFYKSEQQYVPRSYEFGS
jgi:hypothetical protein